MATYADLPSDVRSIIWRKAARLTITERLERLLQRRPQPTMSSCGDCLQVSFYVNDTVVVDLDLDVTPADSDDPNVADVLYQERHWDSVSLEILDISFPSTEPEVVVVLHPQYRRSWYMYKDSPPECVVVTTTGSLIVTEYK